MLKFKQLQIKAPVDKRSMGKLLDELNKKYKLLILGIKKDYLEKLKLGIDNELEFIKEHLFPQDSPLAGGDLIFLEPDTVMYYRIENHRNSIEIGIIGDTDHKSFKEFADCIKKVIGENADYSHMEWEPVRRIDQAFSHLIDDARIISPSKEEIAASRELSNSKLCGLLRVICGQDSYFLDKLRDQVDIANLEEVVEQFEKLGLVNSDYALLCSKTGQQILRVPDRTALDDISRKGFKCFICGNSIADEKLVGTVSGSAFGRSILEEDHWFLVMIINALVNIGISNKELYVVTGDSPGTKVFINTNNEAAMIQLVDGDISLDDAYLINANISAYKIRYLIIISTGKLSLLMKSHLREANPDCEIDFIEGLENLTEDIHKILMEKGKKSIEEILRDTSFLTPLPIEDLIMRKMFPHGRIQPRTGLEDPIFSNTEEVDISLSTPLDTVKANNEEVSAVKEFIDSPFVSSSSDITDDDMDFENQDFLNSDDDVTFTLEDLVAEEKAK